MASAHGVSPYHESAYQALWYCHRTKTDLRALSLATLLHQAGPWAHIVRLVEVLEYIHELNCQFGRLPSLRRRQIPHRQASRLVLEIEAYRLTGTSGTFLLYTYGTITTLRFQPRNTSIRWGMLNGQVTHDRCNLSRMLQSAFRFQRLRFLSLCFTNQAHLINII